MIFYPRKLIFLEVSTKFLKNWLYWLYWLLVGMLTDKFKNFTVFKGRIISKELLVSSNSPKKRTNEFVFTTTKNSFVRFLGEFEDTKKSFPNYLTFTSSFCFFAIIKLFCTDMKIKTKKKIVIMFRKSS